MSKLPLNNCSFAKQTTNESFHLDVTSTRDRSYRDVFEKEKNLKEEKKKLHDLPA